jgi:hypothetical protein
MMKTISILMIIVLVFPMSAEARVLDTKTVGKLTMTAILLATAFVVKILVGRDKEEAVRLHEWLGPPDRSMEFQEGFDHWRVEWYGDRVYTFRNGVLQKQHPEAEIER